MRSAAPVLMSDRLVICDAGALTDPDLATVDALARFALTARRLGRGVHLRNASNMLWQILELAGLADVVPCDGCAIEVLG